jgi:hypothetical protein
MSLQLMPRQITPGIRRLHWAIVLLSLSLAPAIATFRHLSTRLEFAAPLLVVLCAVLTMEIVTRKRRVRAQTEMRPA